MSAIGSSTQIPQSQLPSCFAGKWRGKEVFLVQIDKPGVYGIFEYKERYEWLERIIDFIARLFACCLFRFCGKRADDWREGEFTIGGQAKRTLYVKDTGESTVFTPSTRAQSIFKNGRFQGFTYPFITLDGDSCSQILKQVTIDKPPRFE